MCTLIFREVVLIAILYLKGQRIPAEHHCPAEIMNVHYHFQCLKFKSLVQIDKP